MIDLGPLGLYEDIDDTRPRARDSCTSYATENTDYLTVSSKFRDIAINIIFLLYPSSNKDLAFTSLN